MRKTKRRICFILSAVVIFIITIVLLQGKNLISLLYHSGFFHHSFDNIRIDAAEDTQVFNFQLSVNDMQFLANRQKNSLPGARTWKEVNLNIDGKKYIVEISHFENYFKKFHPVGTKHSFSIRFPQNNYFDYVNQYDLFLLKEIDLFEQELIYNLGRKLDLYIPKTAFIPILFDYSDYGTYTFKQALDQVFLDQNRLGDAIILMFNKTENENYTIQYLYEKSLDEDTESHLKQFLELLKIGDENILFKYFDLDYLYRFETLRRLLKADIGFIIADNLRFVYNRSNGKLYPILDEANILNMRYRTDNFGFRNLTDLIEYGPGFYQKSTGNILKKLADQYEKIINFHNRCKKKFKGLEKQIIYRLKINLVADFFSKNVYKKIQKSVNSPEPVSRDFLPYPGQHTQGDRYLDQLFISPAAFVKNNSHLLLEQKDNKIILLEGNYILDKSLLFPYGSTFEISAGTTIKINPGVSIACYSPVHIKGTEESPVIIEPVNPDIPFGVFAVIGNKNNRSEIYFLDFSGSGSAFVSGAFHTGGICFQDMDVKIENSKIHHTHSDYGLKVYGGSVFLKNNDFHANDSDFINLINCNGILEQNRLYFTGKQSGSDGLNIAASDLIIKNNLFENFRDKGSIISRDSQCVFYENIFRSDAIGAAVKDSAEALFWGNSFIGDEIAVTAYQKDPAFSGGHIYALGNHFTNTPSSIFFDPKSRVYQAEKSALLEKKITGLIVEEKIQSSALIFDLLKQTLPVSKNSLNSLSIGGYQADINEQNKAIYVRLPIDSGSRQEIIFSCREKDTDVYISPTLQGIQQVKNGEKKKILNNSTYDFKEFIFYGKMTLKSGFLLDEFDLYITDSNLAVITIDTRNKSGVLKEIRNEPKIPCKIGYFPAANFSQENSAAGAFDARIEGRGQKRPKWKYGFTLDRAAALEGMNKAKKWVLESSYIDKSLMRGKITFDILEEFRENKSLPRLAPQSRFVEVILNRDYVGVYLLIEHIDKDFVDLEDFDKNEEFNAFLYRAEDRNANLTPFNTFPLKKNIYRFFPGKEQPGLKVNDPIKGWHSGFSQRFPDPKRYGEHWQPIEDFSKFTALSPDRLFQQRIFEILDMASYIDLWILTQLADDTDGLFQNRYFARHKGKDAKWIIFPWDKDGVFGRNYKMEKRPYNEWLNSPLFRRCWQLKFFRDSFFRKWRKLVNTGIISTENIFRMIEANKSLLKDSWQRNFRRWPVDDSLYPDDLNFLQEIDTMKTWIKNRIEWLNNYIKESAGDEL